MYADGRRIPHVRYAAAYIDFHMDMRILYI
jgi:hypothetical protein